MSANQYGILGFDENNTLTTSAELWDRYVGSLTVAEFVAPFPSAEAAIESYRADAPFPMPAEFWKWLPLYVESQLAA